MRILITSLIEDLTLDEFDMNPESVDRESDSVDHAAEYAAAILNNPAALPDIEFY